MAKKNSTITFKDAYIDVTSDTITEVTKDGTIEHSLKYILETLEGKCLNISFRENIDIPPKSEV